MPRFPVLDGWRGISILAVLAAHMLPLGPKSWQLNDGAALLGMALFFTLSGFLIAKTLIHDPNVQNFVIRRLCRILPLAWLFSLVVLPMVRASAGDYGATLLFYANLPPYHLTTLTGHYWSLCVEMQFYVFVALLFVVGGSRSLLLLIPAGLIITTNRVMHGVGAAISTPYRADEIFAGAALALIHSDHLGSVGRGLRRALATVNPWILVALFLLACYPSATKAEYFRPYLAAALVGTTLIGKNHLAHWLTHRTLAYIGEISYALYVIHPLTIYGWFGGGTKLIKYAKRPFCIALSFVGAHASTRNYEKRWIALGKKLIARTQTSQSATEAYKPSAIQADNDAAAVAQIQA
jgi:peptidoglycan/LPS O-acetylase OafA/YrhL